MEVAHFRDDMQPEACLELHSYFTHVHSHFTHELLPHELRASSLVARASSAVATVRIAQSLCHLLRHTSSFRHCSRRVCSLGRHCCRAPSASLIASAPFIAVVIELSPPPLLLRQNRSGDYSRSRDLVERCLIVVLLLLWRRLEKRWESLLHMGRRIIVVGDLNIAPSAIDRCDAGPEFDNNEFRRWFRSILTQYKRAKPESILSAHRWKGGRSIKLEGSDHAPVFMTLVDIPDVSLHLLTKDKFLRASKNQSRSVTKAPTMKGIHTTEDRRGIGVDMAGVLAAIAEMKRRFASQLPITVGGNMVSSSVPVPGG
ncbi:hypothetical protein Ahy_B03g066092 isoform B [Arachis hypogaea]|uniref:Endonuclease/exonuclease/phosphatase domain-containing protein n=1 Tax=Arachis hypogaea TaxID=3818 RepID=A0A445A315_ARAHY|nr:hypothetical protein Ahy_B03g066092 isoform B [Arachis hypogaea]